MCRASFAPAVYKLSCTTCKTGSHVRIAKGKDWSFLVDSLSNNEFEASVSILCDCKISNRTCVWIELCQISAACFAMEHWYDLHGRFLIRNISITTSGMTDNADVIIEINGIHLGKLACAGNCLQNTHCHGNLHITLNSTCSTLFDQHRECRNQHTVKDTSLALCKSVIMGSDHSKMLILYPFLKCYNIFCHIPYFLNCSAALNIKGVQNILSFCTNCILICDIIRNCPHFFPVKLFGIKEHSVVQVGLINVKIHHTWVRSSNLGNICVTESSSYLSCFTPVFNLSLNIWISAFYNTSDNSMSLSSSLKVSNSFSNSTAGISFAEPCSNVCVIVIQSFQLLNIYQNNRNIQVTDCRKHVVGCSVG